MLRWLVGCWLALASIVLPTSALAGKRVALVIGNNAYAYMGQLSNAVRDAERIGALLAASGFEVVNCPGQLRGCFNANRENLLDVLDSLRQAVKDAELVVVFYSGHGMEGTQGNVLAPVDMQVECGEKQPRRQVLLNQLLEALAGAPQRIVILDACRNDPLPKCPPTRGFVPVSFGSFAIPAGGRVMLVSSTKPGQVAFDGVPGGHSPFARALIHWMEQSPALYFNQLLDQVAKMVIEETSHARFTQVPEILSSGGAPEDCLVGKSCEADPRTSALKAELELLRKNHAGDQDYRQIAEAFLKGIGVRSAGKALSDDEKQKALRGVEQAVRVLASRGDESGDKALSGLKGGDNTEAAKIFSEELAATEKKARTVEGREQAQLRAEAARAARNLAALERPKSVAKAAEYYKKAVELDPGDAQTWYDLGETARDAGRTAEALSAFGRAAELAKTEGKTALAVRSLYRQGDMASRRPGERSARDLFEAALATAKHGAEGRPDDLDLQRDLVQAYFRIGDLQWGEGNLSDGFATYQTSLAVADRLSKTNPNNALWQRDLSAAYNRIADVHFHKQELAAALENYRRGLDIIAPVAKAEPNYGPWQREHSFSLNRVGDVLKEQGDLAGALKSYREAMAIRARLSKENPSHIDWLYDLGLSHHLVGSVLLDQKQLPPARTEFETRRQIMVRLVRADPNQLNWQREFSLAQIKVGDVFLEQRNASGALIQYRDALRTREQLAKREPNDIQRKFDLAIGHWRVARALARQGARKPAAGEFEQSRILLQDCVERAPQFVSWANDLAKLNQEIAALAK